MTLDGPSVSGLEGSAREVTLGYGVKVQSFWDPPCSRAEDAPTPVKRWRVVLPAWHDPGSWLHGNHSFPSLDVALEALESSGALDAIEAYSHARSMLSAARQKSFSALLTAYGSTDRDYTELLRERAMKLRGGS